LSNLTSIRKTFETIGLIILIILVIIGSFLAVTVIGAIVTAAFQGLWWLLVEGFNALFGGFFV